MRLLIAIAAMLCFGQLPVQAALLHPQDGPHADIRIVIDEDGVRIGVMINLAFIDEEMPFYRESTDAVHEVEEDALRLSLSEHFLHRTIVEIDGVEVSPVIAGFEMLRPEVENLPLFPRSGMRGLLRARIELTYPAKSHPRSVRFKWSGYPPNVLADVEPGETLPPIVVEMQLSAEGLVDILEFTQDEPERTWHGTGLTREERFETVPEFDEAVERRIPVLALGAAVAGCAGLVVGLASKGRKRGWMLLALACFASAPVIGSRGSMDFGAGASDGMPTQSEAVAIFTPLHGNIYRAFDYETQSEIYDALARSVDGELLETLYDQIYRSLIMYEEGGAVSRVSAVRLMETEILSIGMLAGSTPGFTARARWQVDGVVYHAGHSHRRTNEYLAEYVVAHRERGWRILSHRVLEQNRIDPVMPENRGPARPLWFPDGEI
ncbi:MAG: hypothetical protein KF757_06275 [Phycisphaeraceae bacterium]|nr:hypothetical protein [Phycisphaeraceae bacterium]